MSYPHLSGSYKMSQCGKYFTNQTAHSKDIKGVTLLILSSPNESIIRAMMRIVTGWFWVVLCLVLTFSRFCLTFPSLRSLTIKQPCAADSFDGSPPLLGHCCSVKLTVIHRFWWRCPVVFGCDSADKWLLSSPQGVRFGYSCLN